MNLEVTYYLDVISSWCHWAEPAWLELNRRYSDRVSFQWEIAVLDAGGLPASKAQEDWFYRRSGLITGSPYMLRSEWLEPGLKEYLAPNCAAVAARELGVADDRARLAIANAALREGRRVADWGEAVHVAAAATGLNAGELLRCARSPEVEGRVRQTTEDFHALKVTQRPAFVLESGIGDRAVLSGLWRLEPLQAVLESMLADAAAYQSWKAHFGEPPTH